MQPVSAPGGCWRPTRSRQAQGVVVTVSLLAGYRTAPIFTRLGCEYNDALEMLCNAGCGRTLSQFALVAYIPGPLAEFLDRLRLDLTPNSNPSGSRDGIAAAVLSIKAPIFAR